MSPWEKLLERPHSGGHFVQFHDGDEQALAKNVGHYFWEGLKRGEGALLIATPERQALISRELDDLGADLPELFAQRRIVCCDAKRTLSRLLSHGQPDWRTFEKVLSTIMRQVRPAQGCELVRAYGEMVALLWNARQFSAALRLEQLWNKLLEQGSFSLYCAYEIDLFDTRCDIANLESILCTHTHLIPANSRGQMEEALSRAMEEALGPRMDACRAMIESHQRNSWAVLPSAENLVIWLRRNLPDHADEIMARARHHYRNRPRSADASG